MLNSPNEWPSEIASSTPRLASAFLPRPARARFNGDSACMIPNRSFISRKPTSARSASCSASASRPVQRRRLDSSVCIISAGHGWPHRRASLSTATANRLGVVEPPEEVRHVGAQALRPADAAAVADRLEALLGFEQLRLGVGEVARLEGHPGEALMGPGVAALVGDLVVDLHRLVEEPPGIGERAPEDLGEATRPQPVGEPPGLAQLPEQRDGTIELPAGGVEVALHLPDRAEAPAGLGLVDPVAVGQRPVEHLLGVGDRLGVQSARPSPRWPARAAVGARSRHRPGAGRGRGWRDARRATGARRRRRPTPP